MLGEQVRAQLDGDRRTAVADAELGAVVGHPQLDLEATRAWRVPERIVQHVLDHPDEEIGIGADDDVRRRDQLELELARAHERASLLHHRLEQLAQVHVAALWLERAALEPPEVHQVLQQAEHPTTCAPGVAQRLEELAGALVAFDQVVVVRHDDGERTLEVMDEHRRHLVARVSLLDERGVRQAGVVQQLLSIGDDPHEAHVRGA